MKVIKIDVKQEVMDLEPDRRDYFFYEHGREDMPSMLMDGGELPSEILHHSYSTYRVIKVYEPLTKQSTNYLIKLADNGIANTLVKIENDILSSIIYERSMIAYNDGWERSKNYVKKCSLWKRLLNKF